MSSSREWPGNRVAEGRIAAKLALECAMRGEPESDRLRTVYFEHLERIARNSVGLCHAWLPELPHPLAVRCGTQDIDNLVEIFLYRIYDFPLEAPAPARILDLGAYVGYAAVFLANRFPEAQILCVEPVPANFRILLLNTLAYRNTAHLNAAAWSHDGRLQLAAINGGHQGYRFAEPAEGDQGGYRCFPVAEILRMRGWDRVDLVKCDIAGSEAALVCNSAAEWTSKAEIIAIKQGTLTQDGAASLLPQFDETLFIHTRHGKLDLYTRRDRDASIPNPPVIPLIHSGPGLTRMEVHHARPEPRAFFLFDDRGCQLHPNAPGGPPAQLVFTVDCQGQNRFTSVVLHAGQQAEDVIFHVVIRRLSDGAILMDSARRALAGAGAEWSERIPKLIGLHEVTLETEMAPGATGNANAWARWIDPRLG